MAQFVIMGQVGRHKLYLNYEGAGSTTWVDSLGKAKFFSTQRNAEIALQEITNEREGFDILCDTHYTAPRTFKLLVNSGYNESADVKLSIVAISTVVLSTERWHVEDGKGRTKRLS